MAGNPYVVTLTGLSTTNGYPLWIPDLARSVPFNVSIACVTASSSAGFTVQHSFDYPGANSSAYQASWNSTAATWWASSGITGNSCSLYTTYNYPITAIRLNSTGGSSTNTITMTIVQAG